jgi:hypothetical protein
MKKAILGISEFSHDSAAAILVDGEDCRRRLNVHCLMAREVGFRSV